MVDQGKEKGEKLTLLPARQLGIPSQGFFPLFMLLLAFFDAEGPSEAAPEVRAALF